MSELAAKLLDNPITARKLALAIREAQRTGQPRAIVFLDAAEFAALAATKTTRVP